MEFGCFLVFALVALIVAIVAVNRASKIQSQVEELAKSLAELQSTVRDLRRERNADRLRAEGEAGPSADVRRPEGRRSTSQDVAPASPAAPAAEPEVVPVPPAVVPTSVQPPPIPPLFVSPYLADDSGLKPAAPVQ